MVDGIVVGQIVLGVFLCVVSCLTAHSSNPGTLTSACSLYAGCKKGRIINIFVNLSTIHNKPRFSYPYIGRKQPGFRCSHIYFVSSNYRTKLRGRLLRKEILCSATFIFALCVLWYLSIKATWLGRGLCFAVRIHKKCEIHRIWVT